jgi:plastocyanin
MKTIAIAAVAALAVALAVALPALAAPSATVKLKASVGPGTTISMSTKPKKAGTYSIVVSDKSSAHNFHILGPGLPAKNTKAVKVATEVSKTGTFTLTGLKLQAGKTYRFICDPHKSFMKGSFTVPA